MVQEQKTGNVAIVSNSSRPAQRLGRGRRTPRLGVFSVALVRPNCKDHRGTAPVLASAGDL